MSLLAIWRYPAKAMLGELVDRVAVGLGGLHGDRRWVVADAGSEERIASKRGPTDARLRECRARIRADGALSVVLPGGRAEVTAVPEVADALSDLLGLTVELIEHGGEGVGLGETGGTTTSPRCT